MGLRLSPLFEAFLISASRQENQFGNWDPILEDIWRYQIVPKPTKSDCWQWSQFSTNNNFKLFQVVAFIEIHFCSFVMFYKWHSLCKLVRVRFSRKAKCRRFHAFAGCTNCSGAPERICNFSALSFPSTRTWRTSVSRGFLFFRIPLRNVGKKTYLICSASCAARRYPQKHYLKNSKISLWISEFSYFRCWRPLTTSISP